MSVPRINIKNIDYFKFKKLVIDANRDDYLQCSKEVKGLCDCVQTLKFRDEEFDDDTDRGRFEEICHYYRDILASRRIDPTDMRIKSGWWGDHKNAYSAGKLKPLILRDVLMAKAKEWEWRHGTSEENIAAMLPKIDGPGIYVFKHKEHQCFQSIGRADKIFTRVSERLKLTFEGHLNEPLAALVIITMMTDWDFYFIPVNSKDSQNLLRILENDLILKHDCIWPHGLNFRLHIDSLLEVSEFRKSCLRHQWPPQEGIETNDKHLNLNRLRQQVHTTNEALMVKNGEDAGNTPPAPRPHSATSRPAPTVPEDLFDDIDSVSVVSSQTFTVDMPGMSAVVKEERTPPEPVRDKTPTRLGVKSPKPALRPSTGSGTPKKSQSRLKKPHTPKSARPKSDGVATSRESLGLKTASIESLDTATVILSRSSSIGSMDEEGAPPSPRRTAMRPSRLQRPTSSKARPDSLRLPQTAKPR